MTTHPPSLLRGLRDLIPRRSDLTFREALRIAELQALLLVDRVMGSRGLTDSVLQPLADRGGL